jgi:hypothetical protein
MSIPFTQYLRPDGRKASATIERPAEVEAIAQELIGRGVRFEVEHLRTGEASFEAVVTDEEGDVVTIAIEIVENGPPVPEAVDRLILAAQAHFARAS